LVHGREPGDLEMNGLDLDRDPSLPFAEDLLDAILRTILVST
jgi:hypothetical protein